MTEEAAFDRLHDGKSYKVYHDGGFPFRYTVTEPNGRVLTATVTVRGARRAVRRHARKAARRAWWEAPIVAELTPVRIGQETEGKP